MHSKCLIALPAWLRFLVQADVTVSIWTIHLWPLIGSNHTLPRIFPPSCPYLPPSLISNSSYHSPTDMYALASILRSDHWDVFVLISTPAEIPEGGLIQRLMHIQR